MADLEERFQSLARTPPPDLWHEAIARETRSPFQGNSPRRALAALTALIVAGAGFAAVVVSFRGDEHPGADPEPTPSLGPRANGPIWFRVGDGDGPSFVYEVRPDGTGERLVFGSKSDPLRVSQVAWSPDGGRIAYVDPVVGDRGVYVSDPGGRDPVRLTDGANDGWPTWSPDGTKIAFSGTRSHPSEAPCSSRGDSDLLCPTDIYVMDADGSNVFRLTTDPAPEYRPAWSPDGSSIAFVKAFNGSATAVYVMNADGTGELQVSSHDGGSDFSPSWSPDGSQLAFASIRYEDWGIFVVNADGTGERPLVFKGPYVNDPVWSPNGELIAFVGLGFDDSLDSQALYVMRPDGSAITRLTSELLDPYGVSGDIAWRPIIGPAEGPELTLRGEIAATLPVGEDVRSIVYGDGSVWVAVSNNDGTFAGQILRIDPATNETLATIPVETIPTWEVGGGAMVAADGSLWVTGGVEGPGGPESAGGGSDAALVRIDTSTNAVADQFTLGGTVGADLTFLEGDLWVLVFGDETVDHRMEVVRADPATGDVLARIPLTAGWAHRIVAAGGRLLVIEGGPRVVNEGGRMTSIDPATNQVAASAGIPTRYSPHGPVQWRGELWASLEGGFARFDPVTGQLLERSTHLDPSRFAIGLGYIETDDRGIWFLGYDGLHGGGAVRLDRFDPETDAVTELVELDEGCPVAMAVGPDSAWILSCEGTLTRVDLIEG